LSCIGIVEKDNALDSLFQEKQQVVKEAGSLLSKAADREGLATGRVREEVLAPTPKRWMWRTKRQKAGGRGGFSDWEERTSEMMRIKERRMN
jgi:hypothetical protein